MEKKRFYKVIRAFKHNGIKAIDLAIKEFENDYHHRDIDVVGLERPKEL